MTAFIQDKNNQGFINSLNLIGEADSAAKTKIIYLLGDLPAEIAESISKKEDKHSSMNNTDFWKQQYTRSEGGDYTVVERLLRNHSYSSVSLCEFNSSHINSVKSGENKFITLGSYQERQNGAQFPQDRNLKLFVGEIKDGNFSVNVVETNSLANAGKEYSVTLTDEQFNGAVVPCESSHPEGAVQELSDTDLEGFYICE